MARYVLVIGITDYQSLGSLQKTRTDAEAVARLLQPYGDFQFVKRLPSGWNPDRQAWEVGEGRVTSDELRQELKTLLLEQAAKGDALIYFAGHGFTVSDNFGKPKRYLAASDYQVETEMGGTELLSKSMGLTSTVSTT
jgi:uncharacterized caspase-like protein